MKIPIKEVDYGVASCIEVDGKKWIQINKHLKNYPKLCRCAMADVIALSKSNRRFNFRMSLKEFFNMNEIWEEFKFCIKYPKAFYDFSPLFYENKKLGVNWFNLSIQSVGLGIFLAFLRIMHRL